MSGTHSRLVWIAMLAVALLAVALGLMSREPTSQTLTKSSIFEHGDQNSRKTEQGRTSSFPQPTSSQPPVLKSESHYVAENDPTNDRYDPTRLAMSVGDPAVPWNIEIRAEPWATEREASLTQWLAEHLKHVSPNAKVELAECKSRTCKLIVAVDESQMNDLMDRYPIFMLSPSTSVTGGSGGQSVFYLMFPKDLLSRERYDDYLKKTLQQLEKGGSDGT